METEPHDETQPDEKLPEVEADPGFGRQEEAAQEQEWAEDAKETGEA